jgi:hypothetical protein
MAQGNPKPLSRKGSKWGEAIKSEPWGSKSVSWQEIKSSFPAGWDPETAIKKTVAACKRHGLIKTINSDDLSEADYQRIRRQILKKNQNEKRHL